MEYTLYIANLPPVKMTRESALALWKHSGVRMPITSMAQRGRRIYVMRATTSAGEIFNFGIAVRPAHVPSGWDSVRP